MKKYLQITLVFLLFLCIIPMLALLVKKDSHEIGETVIDKKLDDIKNVRILDEKNGEIIELSLHDYLVGAVLAQMPYDFEEEALKAQAVLAHTYILSRREAEMREATPALSGADISLDSKVYQPYFDNESVKALYGDKAEDAIKRVSSAVSEAEKEVAEYKGELIISAFHGISSGFTESAENAWGIDIPYLQSVESEFDPSSPDYCKKYTISANELKEALESAYPDLTFDGDETSWLDISETSRGGTVLGVGIGDEKLVVSGYDLMKVLDLRSPHFKISYSGGEFTFTVCGCGHLVGMSQYGANELAKTGKDHLSVLKFYFKGIDIVTLE